MIALRRNADGRVRTRFGRRAGVAHQMSFNHDGLQIARVKRRRSRYLPIWHIIFFIYFVYLMRLMAMADLGVGAYQARIDELAQGSWVERTTAHIMQADPISRDIAADIRNALKSWSAHASQDRWGS